MEFLIYLLTGLFIGGLIGYFVFKSTIQKNHIPKPDFENLRQQFTELQVDHAKRISKEELNQQYISKTLFESVNTTLSATKNELTKKQEEAATQQ